MRTPRQALPGLLGRGDVALIAVAAAVMLRAWMPAPSASATDSQRGVPANSPSSQMIPGDSLDAAEQRLVASNPFRTEDEPGRDLAMPPGVTAPAISPLLPRGVALPPPIVGVTLQALAGPPWTAVVAGLPGQPGQAVLMVGDSAGTYRVTAIRRDTVILQGKDSTLHLTLRKEVR